MKREDTKRARLIRFLTCRTVREQAAARLSFFALCAVAAAASLLHGVVCLVWQGKVWMGFYGMDRAVWVGCLDCLDCLDRLDRLDGDGDGDGMVWVWMQSMRVHAWAGLNQSLIQQEVLGWVRCMGVPRRRLRGSLDSRCMQVCMYMRTVHTCRLHAASTDKDVPSPSEMRSPRSILDMDRNCEIAMTVCPGQGHGLLWREEHTRTPAHPHTWAYTTSPPVSYLLASVIGEFAGAIPHPGGVHARLAALHGCSFPLFPPTLGHAP